MTVSLYAESNQNGTEESFSSVPIFMLSAIHFLAALFFLIVCRHCQPLKLTHIGKIPSLLYHLLAIFTTNLMVLFYQFIEKSKNRQ